MTAYVSAFDLFSIGIGPSSSHTVGPMKAARDFVSRLRDAGTLTDVSHITCDLYGSLGATGIGHGTPGAVIAGLRDLDPETCDPADVRTAWTGLEDNPQVALAGTHVITFHMNDIVFNPLVRLPQHPNAMKLTAGNPAGETISSETYFSIGGGFILRDGDTHSDVIHADWAHPFATSEALMAACRDTGLSIAQVAMANELARHTRDEVEDRLDRIWKAMSDCVDAGLNTEGILPGGLKVRRRAALVSEHLSTEDFWVGGGRRDTTIEWLQSFALAVNEENAGGGRVVTAPTNGAAGIVPAVAKYYMRFVPGANIEGIRTYLLTATAIGSLFKTNASISGAEAGCQGEVGPACAMAAAGLCAVLGGTPEQVENAAEIAMEHHLGLTCDPVGGLVQVPCIERNAIASSTAVNVARLALHGDGNHIVSLDTVIETMRQTGLDMSTKYKETSEGGLAVNVVEC